MVKASDKEARYLRLPGYLHVTRLTAIPRFAEEQPLLNAVR